MKSVICAAVFFFSYSVMAGDLYLVCEHTKYDRSFTSRIDNGAAKKLIIPGEHGEFFLLQLNKIDNELISLFKLEITNLNDELSETKNLSISEETLVGQFICAVRD